MRVVYFLQVLHQVAGGALLLLSLSKGKEVNKFAMLSAAAGLLAIVVGELGDISVLTSIALIPYVLIFSIPKKNWIDLSASSEENCTSALQLYKSQVQ